MRYEVLKRVFDIVGSFLALVVLFPVFIVIAISIKLDSKGPVLFKQKRTGRYGKDFKLMKFRSMSECNNVYDKDTGDKVTRVGKILRKTSLDELPQFINVLKGDMSFIGPRPWIPEYYQNMTPKQRHRNDVRPGITGLAQARGRNSISIHEKIALDLRYVNNVSLCEDLKVIYWTLATMFDESTQLIGKHGIHDEIEALRKQSGDGSKVT